MRTGAIENMCLNTSKYIFLPPAYGVRGKVMFWQASVLPSIHLSVHRGGSGTPRGGPGTPQGGPGTPRGVRVPPGGSGYPPGGPGTPRGVRVPPLGWGGQVWVPPGGVRSGYPPGGLGTPRGGQVPPRGLGTPPGGPGTPQGVRSGYPPRGSGPGTPQGGVRVPTPPGGWVRSSRGEGGQHGGWYASCVHAGGLSFSNWSYPVLTTTQNDEKLHIFYSDSLVILSIWAHYAWRDMYRWGECIWTGVIENWNENMQ